MSHEAIFDMLEVLCAFLSLGIAIGALLWNAQRRVVKRVEQRQKVLLECDKWKLEQMNAPDHIIGAVTNAMKNGE